MDKGPSELQSFILQSQDEPEFGFDDTFSQLEFQEPIEGLQDVQHDPIDHVHINHGTHFPGTGCYSLPTMVGRMTGLGSQTGCRSDDLSMLDFNHASLQGRAFSNGHQSFHTSPMLNPLSSRDMLSSTDMFFPELAGTSFSSNSLNDNMAGFSLEPSSWTAPGFPHPGMRTANHSIKYNEMSSEKLQHIFHGPPMMDAVVGSPFQQGHKSMAHYDTMPMDISASGSTSGFSHEDFMQGQLGPMSFNSSGWGSSTSPSISPMLGPDSSNLDNSSVSNFPMLSEPGSAQSSPALPAQDAGKREGNSRIQPINFVSMEVSPTQGRPIPGRNNSKKAAGRKGPLASETRANAAQMRHLGVCGSCKKRKSRVSLQKFIYTCLLELTSRSVTPACIASLAFVILVLR